MNRLSRRTQKSPVTGNGAFLFSETDRPFQWPKLLLGANGKVFQGDLIQMHLGVWYYLSALVSGYLPGATLKLGQQLQSWQTVIASQSGLCQRPFYGPGLSR